MSSSKVTVSCVYLIKKKRNNQEIIFIKGSKKRTREGISFSVSDTGGSEEKIQP